MSREKELGLPHDKFKHAYLCFAHCHKEKLYVFYEPRETTAGGRMAAFEDIRLRVLCKESLRTLKEGRLSGWRTNLTGEMTRDRFAICTFAKMFCDDRKEKLFIRVFGRFGEGEESWVGLIVYDMKNDHFHVHETPHPLPLIYTENFKFAKGRDGEIYGVRYYVGERDNFTEIRTFRLEGFEFVTDKKWEENEGSGHIPVVWSSCYV